MKKLVFTGLILSITLLVSGCGKETTTGNSEVAETTTIASTSETVETSGEIQETNTILTGKINGEVTANQDAENSWRIYVTEVDAKEDPEGILASMKDGIVLNATAEQLAEGLTMADLKAGNQVEFTVSSPAATTMSIPPQLLGNALVELRVLDEE